MDILKIGKSKTRVSILRHFFANPDKKYYLRELEKILGISVGNIRRELLDLKESGLFESKQEGKQVYYFLNVKSSIFPEFKKIVAKTIGAEFVLKEKLMQIKGIKVAFIYGSVARGKEDSFSDVDIFIIGLASEDDLLKAVQKAEKELSWEINYVSFTAKDIKENIKEKDVFLADVLRGKKIFLIGNKNDLEKIIGGRQNSKKEC